MRKAKKYFLFCSVVGLTLISVTAGFDFYYSLFGLSTAILCCAIFEAIRLGCLWAFVFFRRVKRIVAIPVYALVALTCSFAGITSFHARIIESHVEALKPLEEELERRVAAVKRAYAKEISGELKEINQKIDVCKRKLAWSPKSSYWQNRLQQLEKKRLQVMNDRDRFLEKIPVQNRQLWIAQQGAILGVQFEPLAATLVDAATISKAIQELWGITELTAKKVVSLIIIATVEFGIILLSLLSQHRGDEKHASNLVSYSLLLDDLRKKFDDIEIKKFSKKSLLSLTKNARMPLAKELSYRQRAIKKLIINGNLNTPELIDLLKKIQLEISSR